MPITTWNRLCCVIDGDDLLVARVAGSPLSARVEQSARVSRFMTCPKEELWRAFSQFSSSMPITLVLPSELCAIRPIAIDRSTWLRSRGELVASAEGFFPMSTEDAMIGFVEASAAQRETGEPRGYLIAASKQRLAPLLERLELGARRSADSIVSALMILPGLGFQAKPSVGVFESSPTGPVAHRLVFGEVDSLAEPAAPDEFNPADATEVFTLGIGQSDLQFDSVRVVRQLTAEDVALAAAVSPIVAPGAVAPLVGSASRTGKRWAIPAVAAILACAMLWFAGQRSAARFEAGMARLDHKRESLVSHVQAAQVQRQRALELAQRIERAEQITSQWQSLLPEFVAAHSSVPEGGFLYKIELDSNQVSLSGQAPNAGDVLRQIEASPYFERAERTGRSAPVQGGETFEIRATVTKPQSTEPTSK